MRSHRTPIMLAALLSFLLLGCQNPERQKLVGIWEIQQADKLKRRVDTEDSYENENSRMALQFLSSGGLITSTLMGNVQQQKRGTWKFLSFDAAQKTILVASQIGQQSVKTEIEFLDEDTIRLTPPNMAGLSMRLKFKRRLKN